MAPATGEESRASGGEAFAAAANFLQQIAMFAKDVQAREREAETGEKTMRDRRRRTGKKGQRTPGDLQ